MNTKYIGREQELTLLKRLADSSEAELAVLYGRRRVGKSSLVREAYKDKLYFSFEGLEETTNVKQIENFLAQIFDHFPRAEKSRKVTDWFQALSFLHELTQDLECVILLDELQWLANYDGHFISTLKQVWDQKFSKNNKLTMILCGSVASFMVNKVIKSKALYGRSSINIHLKPFKLRETCIFLEKKSIDESIQAHIMVGGIPGYLNKLKLHDSVILGIQSMAFEEHGYLKNEFERIFVSQFGKNKNYENIIRYLANHPYGLTRKQLASFPDISNGGTFTSCLSDLETAGLISSYHSFNDDAKTKKRVYILSDPYCRMYLNFIEQNLERINSGVPGIFTNIIKSPAFSSWMGLGAELLCYLHQHEIARLMGFSDIIYKAGPYLDTKVGTNKIALQIDLVYDRKDSVLTVCEIKYTNQVGLSIIDEVKLKIEKLSQFKKKTIQAALICKNKPSKEVLSSGYFNHIVSLEEIAGVC